MGIIETIALAMGSAWVSGIRLYATVATLGLLGRYAGLQLPESLALLENWWVIGVSSALFVIEFVADKVPVVDSVWDAIHTFIRIPAGAALAAAAFGSYDPSVQFIALLLGGSLAAGAHAAKSGARFVANHSPEPVSNWALSTAEDAYSFGSIAAIAFLPVLAILLVLVGVVAAALLLPKMIRHIKRARDRVSRIMKTPSS